MANRKIPEINAGSTADIAFLLLIFYLVSTTMNVDSGLQRMLPQMADENNQEENLSKERNTMLVFIDANDNLMVQMQRIQVTELKDKAMEFILNPSNREDLPETQVVEIDLIGDFPVSKGVISVQNDRSTSYEMYIKVQNELVRAFNEARDDLSSSKFGKMFADLTDDERTAITKAIPLRISEAEPRNMTEGK
ncbi:MAG: biopolymer transporter ExbD [Rikenellaceae bacterium]